VYLNTFVESFKLALTSTLLICAIGYPFGILWQSCPRSEKARDALLMIPLGPARSSGCTDGSSFSVQTVRWISC
jgi:ABC-type spermidine/putrescine transport system permease subunit I